MTPDQRPPKEGIRAMPPGSLHDDGDGRTLIGHLARPGEWVEIDSAREGHFMETHAPGAFARTFAEDRAKIRILFQHGKDPQLGNRPIADPQEFGEDDEGPFYRAEILDGLDPLIVDGLRRGLYGSSHTFEVVRDDWTPKPKPGPHNPKALPERVIREVRAWEMGPVTWPSYAGTTMARSMSDELDPPKETSPVEYVTREEKAARATELKTALSRQAIEYPGVLPPDAQAIWDADTAELEAIERDIAAWDARQARLAAYAADPAKTERAFEPVASFTRKTETDIYDLSTISREGNPEKRTQLLRDNAVRAAEQIRTPDQRADQDATRQRLVNLLDYADSDDKELARLVLSTNSPQYRSAFNRYVKSGGSERGTALAVGVDGTGGYAVPVSFDPTIIAIGAHTAINPYRASCRVETIVGTDTWQALTATAITAAWAAEAAAADEQGPTFARPEYVAKRAHAFVTVSYEMAQDRPSLDADLGQLFGEAKDNLEENSFTLGAGTTVYPQGIGLKDAFTRVDSVTNDTVAVADIRAVEAALPIRHRMNAAWYLSRAAIRAIQAFETTGGQLFGGVNYAAVGNPVNRSTGNTGLTLLGYPIWETPSMPWTPTVDDTTYGVLMDPRNFVILDRVGMSVKVIPDMLNGATPSFPTGEIGIYAFWRGTARVLNVDGGRQGAVQ